MYNLCREFRALPESGGLMDQHPAIVHQFKVIMVAKAELDKKKNPPKPKSKIRR